MLAQDADGVMEPLTRPDETRTWGGTFHEMWPGGLGGFGWGAEFVRLASRSGLLRHLESLPWPRPESVQVLIHDEEDDCFGLWMMHDGRLVEIPLPRTGRFHFEPHDERYPPDPGVLTRTDRYPAGWPGETDVYDQPRPPAW
ncbi:hypothetical protein [Streptomyces mayteni]